MHIWKIIRQRPDRTPVPVDLALEALRPSSPKALLLRLHNAGHLLEELEPNAIMKAAKDYFAAIGEATNQFDKRLAPVETMTPYLSDPSTWARLHILREELLALRAALRLESLRAARRARLAKESPAEAPPTTTPAAADHQATGPQAAKQGGRPRTQLRQGVEALYLEKLATGQTDILLPGAVDDFMKALKRSITGPEVCEKVAGHIRKLEKRSGRWLVFVHDPPEIDGRPPESNEKPNGYTAADISKIMHKLREKHPLE